MNKEPETYLAQPPDGSAGRAGTLIFILLFAVFSVFLLTRMGSETRYIETAKLAEQPRFWPAVGVFATMGFGLAHLALSWRHQAGWAAAEVLNWFRAIEYLAWFMMYVAMVPVLGYLASTIIFTVLLALRQGYRGVRNLCAAALLGLTIVLVFKTGLSVKIPGGAVYEYLPSSLRSFMIINF